MDKEMERVIKALEKELKKDEAEGKPEHQVIDFMSAYNKRPKKTKKDSWDYLEMAYEADTEKEALKYAKKAFQLDKNCLDAEAMIIELTSETGEVLKISYEKLIGKAEKNLKDTDVLKDENIGSFWGILETRPYMRLRFSYVKLLIQQGKFRKAIRECEELLRLSEGDNLGVRYLLISLYAFFEEEVNVNMVYKNYGKEASVQMLLPMVALYYKLDDYKKAETYLKKLRKVNDELEEVFCSIDELAFMDLEEVMDDGMYQIGSKEEVLITMMDASFLYMMTPSLMLWISEKLSQSNK